MAKAQRFTKLSPGEATSEAADALAAAGLAGFRVSSSPAEVGRQRKVFLLTVASGGEASRALAVLRDLPDVTSAGTMGRGTAYIYRRLI